MDSTNHSHGESEVAPISATANIILIKKGNIVDKSHAGNVEATFDYLRDPPTDDPSLPLCYYTEERSKSTIRHTSVRMPIIDGRPCIDDFNLDLQGFQLVQHRTSVTDFVAAARTGEGYSDEIADLIRATTGAFFATCFGLGVRFGRSRDDYVKANDDRPARFPHADFTDNSSQALLDHIGQDLGDYSRCALFNVWRVFSDPPQDFPMAVCDARTVTTADEEEAEAILDFAGEENALRSMTMVYRPNGANRWVYFSDMTSDEALIFKAWDSDARRPQRVPHSSFANPLAGPTAPSRCSIEARVAAYFR